MSMMCAVISSPLLGGAAIKITAHTPASVLNSNKIKAVIESGSRFARKSAA
jgi:hypothetical protein